MADKLLEIKDLEVLYKSGKNPVHAVNGISLTLNKGETLGLVGETGAGKTTTALAILRLLPERTGCINQGQILFEGRDLLTLSEEEMRTQIRGEKISMIFQDPMTSLNPVATVGDQIAEAIIYHSNGQKVSQEQIDQRVGEVLEMVGIPAARKNEYPHQFSGGMKQRVVIAMALSCQPDLLIADEPTTALDVTIQAQILDLLKELEEQYNTSIVLITHDMGVVANVCTKIAIMYGGLIMECGTTDEIFYEPKHPYTKALLRAIPSLDLKEGERLKSIEGLPPSLINPPKGCPFAERCEFAQTKCFEQMPEYQNFSQTHRAMCFLCEQEGEKTR